jgi:hypothetical protein
MKLKRKLQAIISYMCCPTLNFPQHLYYIWILWKILYLASWCTMLPYKQTYLRLGEFIWTKYVRLVVCAVPACWLNQKSILLRGFASIISWSRQCCFYIGICNHEKPHVETTTWVEHMMLTLKKYVMTDVGNENTSLYECLNCTFPFFL